MKQPILDIRRSAYLALNNYRRFIDPKLHDMPFFYAFFDDQGARASHCEWDFGDATGRYLDAAILCRRIVGDHDTEAEEGFQRALKWMISPVDGLCYRPSGLPWVQPSANMFDQRSALLGLCTWYKDSGESQAFRLIEGIIKGLRSIGIEHDDYFFLPMADYMPGDKVEPRSFDRDVFTDPCHYGGGVHILPLALFYEKTGNIDALWLIERFTRFIVEHSTVFASDGSFWSEGRDGEDGHFHSRMATVAGILRYAVLVDRKDLIAWCLNIYNWARTQGTSFGLFPEGLGRKVYNQLPEEYPDTARHSEICCTTDMIHIAIYLSKCGAADLWNDAEQYLNHLCASQLEDISWIRSASGEEDMQTSWIDVPERYRGAFTGRTMVNDLLSHGHYSTMGCCVAAGGRALWLLWDNAITHEADGVHINMWLTSENPSARIANHLPAEGRLSVEIRSENRLYVRVPCWLEKQAISLTVNNQDKALVFSGRNICISDCKKGDMIEIRFPAVETMKTEKFCGEEYQVFWTGNIVMGISPSGTHIPLYDFNHLA